MAELLKTTKVVQRGSSQEMTINQSDYEADQKLPEDERQYDVVRVKLGKKDEPAAGGGTPKK